MGEKEKKGHVMKKSCKILASLLIINSILSIGSIANAAQIDTVRYRWDEVSDSNNMVNGKAAVSYKNELYKDITFSNGYTYTTSSENITSWWENANGFLVIRYNRTFKTY